MYKTKDELQVERNRNNIKALKEYKLVAKERVTRTIALSGDPIVCIKHPERTGTQAPNLECRVCCSLYIVAIRK